MTAVKVSYPFTLLNSGISTLMGTGSASVLSRAIGKKDRETVDKIMGNLIALLVLILPLLFSNSVEGVFYAQLITYVIVLFIAVILMAGAFKNITQEERLALA